MTLGAAVNGQSIAASGAAGVKILDAKTLTTVADLGLDFCGPAIWNPTVNELSTFGTFSHLCRWKVDTQRVVNGETEIKGQPVAIQKLQPVIGPPQPVQIDPRRAKMGLDSRIPQHQGRFSVWHPSGKWLYFVDYRNHIVYQMDSETGDCEELVKLDNPVSLDISPDGRWLAIGRILTDRVSLLDLTSRHVIAELTHLNQPKFSFDGKYLVGSNFEEVRVYSTADWQLARRWHAETLNRFISINIALSPRSNLLAAAVSESKVRLFDLETGDEFSDISLQRSDPITWLEFDSRCQRLAIVRDSSLSVSDLAQLGSELKSLGLDAPFLPTVSADEIPAQDNSHLVWSVDRGADLLAADRWWTGYQVLAVFEAMSMNYADAIDNMDKALATVQHVDHPSRAAVLVRRAKYHLASQNAHQALSDLRRAQKLQPKEPGVIRELGKLLIDGPVEIRNIPQGQLLLQQLGE